ncbi:MAG: cadmium-translocating P-type ATPase [Acidaminococcus sp.]|jgi:Cd2+/Zn2+-exporting ATPase|nr:cadmium-translocating P-type ATPase [Acidaminococcus sp.]MCI2117057.1 cadmium-translocating P-type ATPase [Acidaminococcus sp.]
MNEEQKKMAVRIAVTAVITIAASVVPDSVYGGSRLLHLIPYLIAYIIIAHDVFYEALHNIMRGQVFDEKFLMAFASLGAFGLGVMKDAEYTEAIAVVLFYQVGELFEDYAVDKSRRNISELMDIRPDYANIERGGKIVKVNPDDVAVGTTIIVQPGEKIPIDGVVLDGNSSLNTVALTGESLPRDVAAGSEVISGCINMTGVLKIKTTKEFGESTVTKILELVEDASSRKSESEHFISKFARYYTPIVCFSALALAVIPPLVRMGIMGLAPEWSNWFYRALIFLVISCPCALVLCVPLTFFAGIGGAGRQGILIKGSNFMETLANARYVIMDKTGTLTKGVFEVTGVHHSKISNEKLLEYAALAESASSHPISKSLQKAHGRELDRSRVTDVQEKSGRGVIAKVDGHTVAAGNDKLMSELGIACIPCHQVGTLVHMAIDGEYAGHILISDVVKDTSREAVKEMQDNGIDCVMLTGDGRKTAEDTAKRLGITKVFSELLPEDKVAKVEEVIKFRRGKEKVLFVGDGINDAPVLSVADVGVAMGAMGSDAAIEAADVVLMDDDPLKIDKAIRISKKCMTIVKENIVFAIGIKVICLVLGALGLANIWLAIFADTGVLILAVLNAMRALFVANV